MRYLCQKCKKLGVTVFVSDIKQVEIYPDFVTLAHVIQHGPEGFIVIEGETTEANNLSLYFVEVGQLRN